MEVDRHKNLKTSLEKVRGKTHANPRDPRAVMPLWSALCLALALIGAPSAAAASPPGSLAAACVVKIGYVYSKTGSLASLEAHAAYTTAIAKINAGDYASGKRAPGFALGKGLPACKLQLVDADNRSNLTLHSALVAALIPQVDFFVIGNEDGKQVISTAQQVVAANMLSKSLPPLPGAVDFALAFCVTPLSRLAIFTPLDSARSLPNCSHRPAFSNLFIYLQLSLSISREFL